MRVIVIGGGKVGEILTNYIIKEGHEVVIIDSDKKTIDEITEKYDANGVLGNGASYDILKKAGAKAAKLIIAVTPSDEVNLMSALVAKKIGTKHAIIRLRSSEYLNEVDFFKKNFQIDMIVNPEYSTAMKIARLLKFPPVLKVEEFGNGYVNLVEITVSKNSPLVSKMLKELNFLDINNCLICGIKRGENIFIPKGNDTICENDILSIIATHKSLTNFFEKINLEYKTVKNAVIIGGGIIGYYLALLLSDMKINTTIIEKDNKRCLELSNLLPKITIICGDGLDANLLEKANINKMDACISLCGNDEANLVLSLFAKNNGVEKIISEITNLSYSMMLHNINIYNTISAHFVTIDMVIKYLRGISNSTQDIKSLTRICDEKVEVIEFDVLSDFKGKNKMLKDLKIKNGVLIAGIIKQKNFIIPNGQSIIEDGNSVIIVSTNKILKLGEILVDE